MQLQPRRKRSTCTDFCCEEIPQDTIQAPFCTLDSHYSIFDAKKGILIYSVSRLQRWAIILLRYNFEIQYCRTTNFGEADVLSHLTSSQLVPVDITIIAAINIEDNFQRTLRLCSNNSSDKGRCETKLNRTQKVCRFLRHSWSPDLTGDLLHFNCHSTSLSSMTDVCGSCCNSHEALAQLAGAVEYTDCTSTER